MKRPAMRVLAIVTLALAGCSHASRAPGSVAPAVSLETVRGGTYVERVTAVGRIGAVSGSQTKLSFALAGILQSVDARIGDRIAAGEELARLDASGLSLAAAQAEAEAQAAQAGATQAAIDRTSAKIRLDSAALERERTLYGAGVSPLKAVQAARAQLSSDRAEAAANSASARASIAQARSAQARAALARRDLYNGTLRSPIDGVVTAVYLRPGEAVDTATPVIAVAPASTNELTLDVAAADAARVRAGNIVHLYVVGTTSYSTGRVVGVSTAIDPATQTATVLVSGTPEGAPAGSAVQAAIDVARDRGIVIPESAIVEDPQTGKTIVFVQTSGGNGTVRFDQRFVTVARRNGTQVLVASGLRPGERIASEGGFALVTP